MHRHFNLFSQPTRPSIGRPISIYACLHPEGTKPADLYWVGTSASRATSTFNPTELNFINYVTFQAPPLKSCNWDLDIGSSSNFARIFRTMEDITLIENGIDEFECPKEPFAWGRAPLYRV
jgi:hypothetical protein